MRHAAQQRDCTPADLAPHARMRGKSVERQRLRAGFSQLHDARVRFFQTLERNALLVHRGCDRIGSADGQRRIVTEEQQVRARLERRDGALDGTARGDGAHLQAIGDEGAAKSELGAQHVACDASR